MIKYKRDGRAPVPASENVSKVMSAIKGKNTTPEMILRKALSSAGIRGYRIHWKKAPGKPDISFPGKKIAIFVHGCFWHRCPKCNYTLPKTHKRYWKQKFQRNIERDERNVKALKDDKWQVIIVWECGIEKNVEKIAKKVSRTLS